MELQDLVGEHVLDAVDCSNEQVKTWGDTFEDCSVIRFRLNGKVYVATEDPSDGYRSCMNDIVEVTPPPVMQNTFVPLRVVARHRDVCEYGDGADILELVDVVTNKIVLEVGTDNKDDYYPSFVSAFHPENMACNVESQP